ncbi:ABC transporter permease [Lipingzhangella sp. LS1_29]|uniref:Transport permease protein n=1 Tax=Lipingzhangella rawalii TaxID=2055835 RepID=A0ABU2HAJ6_9ACTN|nr:ABC transporter permease [Lipingzhangella rawalii]MDS1272347.1 ABC transporter permease [Lipingzhangella rawalii]
MSAAVPRPAAIRVAGIGATSAAIATKTLRAFLRDAQVLVPTLLQGVLFFLVFRFVFAGAIDSGPLAYVDYMTPGIVTTAILFASTQAAVTVAYENTGGFTDRVLSLPVHRVGITLGRIGAHATTVTAAATTTLLAAVLTGFRPHAPTGQLAAAAGILILYAIAFAALFVALGSAASTPAAAQGLAFIAIPLTFVSSAIVPTTTMPSWLAAAADHQPLTPMIDTLRSLTQSDVIGNEPSTTAVALGWALGVTLGSVIAATALAARGAQPARIR